MTQPIHIASFAMTSIIFFAVSCKSTNSRIKGAEEGDLVCAKKGVGPTGDYLNDSHTVGDADTLAKETCEHWGGKTFKPDVQYFQTHIPLEEALVPKGEGMKQWIDRDYRVEVDARNTSKESWVLNKEDCLAIMNRITHECNGTDPSLPAFGGTLINVNSQWTIDTKSCPIKCTNGDDKYPE